MIRLAARHRAPRDTDVVPMINVAFLLLIFLLMVAALAPPDPVEVTPPVANLPAEDRRDDTLYVAADGRLFFRDISGEAVFAALPDAPLSLMADRTLPATALAELLSRLSDVGIQAVSLVTEPR